MWLVSFFVDLDHNFIPSSPYLYPKSFLLIRLIFVDDGRMDKHWTEKLFVNKASLFGARLEELLERTPAEVEGLINILSEHEVPDGGTILDLACGIGRHSILLAEKGYRAVGIDLSPTYIKRARELAEEKGVSQQVDFKVGDMRRIREQLENYEGVFDAVMNLFTSIGYWDEETDRQIFKQVLDLTKLSGIIVIHTVNRDFLIKNFQARDVQYGKNGRVMIADRRLDLESSRMFNTWKYYEQQDEDLEHLDTIELDHRVYSLHELKKQIEDSGWSYQTSYGGHNKQPLTTNSFGMILVAKKLA